jgi:hypothetical protein
MSKPWPPPCRKCGGRMERGVALRNTVRTFEDFPGEPAGRGCTMDEGGPAIMVSVYKCVQCGHSLTAGSSTQEPTR